MDVVRPAPAPVRLLAAASCLLLALGGASGSAAPPTEREVKAAFLCHFPAYVQWPASSFSGPSDPIVVGVVGEDPFGRTLDELVRGRTVDGRALAVRRLSRAAEGRDVHVLYLGYTDPVDVANALSDLAGRSVLTVADGARMAERGAIIGFRVEERKVRFDINVAAAERAGLKLSSQLLKLARLVPDQEAALR